MTLTPGQRISVQRALEGTQRYIDRESARADDLRPADIQMRLEWYKGHAIKLQNMLEN